MTGRIVTVLTAMLALGGCTADLSSQIAEIGHPVGAEQRALVAVFDRPAADTPLSAYDRDRLVRLAREALKRGAGPMVLTIHDRADQDFAEALAEQLRREGATKLRIELAAESKDGGIELRVPVWSALIPECGRYDWGMNPDYTNAPNVNGGCSVQRNRALMVQNPGDLVRAGEASGRDGDRGADVLAKYGRGEATGSAREATSSGSASSVAH